MMRDITNSETCFALSASDSTAEDEVSVDGRHGPLRLADCEALRKMIGVPESLIKY